MGRFTAPNAARMALDRDVTSAAELPMPVLDTTATPSASSGQGLHRGSVRREAEDSGSPAACKWSTCE